MSLVDIVDITDVGEVPFPATRGGRHHWKFRSLRWGHMVIEGRALGLGWGGGHWSTVIKVFFICVRAVLMKEGFQLACI